MIVNKACEVSTYRTVRTVHTYCTYGTQVICRYLRTSPGNSAQFARHPPPFSEKKSKSIRAKHPNMFSQPMMSHYSTADADAYAGKSAETRHLKPGELSTGTTIMAVSFNGGVVLCAGE